MTRLLVSLLVMKKCFGESFAKPDIANRVAETTAKMILKLAELEEDTCDEKNRKCCVCGFMYNRNLMLLCVWYVYVLELFLFFGSFGFVHHSSF